MSKTTPDPSLSDVKEHVQKSFLDNRTIMSFQEYFEVVLARPEQHLRSSAQYVVDMMEHYGTEEVERPTGTVTRYSLFDMPFAQGEGRVAGQEDVQLAIHRTLSNFAREGRVNKLMLLHGPNGSAKSSLVRALMAGMEDYSHYSGGAIYSFNWIWCIEDR